MSCIGKVAALLRRNRMKSHLDRETAFHLEIRTRDAISFLWLEDLCRDARFALRILRRNLGIALIAILCLSLGIGVTTSVYSVANALFEHPYPFKEMDRLAALGRRLVPVGLDMLPFRNSNFLELRKQTRSFDALATFCISNYNLTGGGESRRVSGLSVSPSFLSVLGVRPAIGRDFSTDEAEQGKNRVALISHGLWQRAFAGAPTSWAAR